MTTTRDWSAWYNRMPGTNDPLLHVSGTCELTSGSDTARLELRPDGVVDEPGVVTLQLVVDRSEIGDERMSDYQVTWAEDVGPDTETVRIRVPDGDTVSVEVTIAQ